MTLFRQQAIDHAMRRLAGDVVIHSSGPRMAATFALAAVLTLCAVFAGTMSYARKETVRGQVTTSAGLIRLSTRQAGLIEAIHVSEGDLVSAGQVIATVRVSAGIASGDSYDLVAKSIEDRVAAAEQIAASRVAGLAAERGRLETRRIALSGELAEARARTGLTVQNITLATDAMKRAEHLQREGAMSQRELEQQRAIVLAAQTDASAARAEVLRLAREIGDIDASMAALTITSAEASAEAAATRAMLQGQRTEAEASANQVVRAELAGRVSALPVHVGDTLGAGEVVAVLTPAGAMLEAELAVPTSAAGFLEVGQPVNIMYDAFPHQKFGVAKGAIRSVSRTAVSSGAASSPPIFIVRVAIEREHISAYGREIALQPGLMLAADIILDRRSLLEWVLDPIFALQRGRQ